METTIKLEFTQAQLNAIIAGLQELPFKHAAPVVETIVQQVQAAQKATEAPVEQKTAELEE